MCGPYYCRASFWARLRWFVSHVVLAHVTRRSDPFMGPFAVARRSDPSARRLCPNLGSLSVARRSDPSVVGRFSPQSSPSLLPIPWPVMSPVVLAHFLASYLSPVRRSSPLPGQLDIYFNR